MKNRFKLGLLSAVATAMLALPLAASAETPSRIEILSAPLQSIGTIQLPVIDAHNPPMFHDPIDLHNPPMFHNPPMYLIP
ncbi:hypothetical protein SAMN05216312_101395 [Cohnella sp. OV330]|uniref:hypothetical protein n=1 Tax=Cohnella sp. OV330 TaxID=1855288 RepID=UPI0008DF35D0|nr:hypothetical protein [Cohnella sp. OV330]SFA77245.1 hypothetical protein SAMN05216312_101395 [Cohnella sp. OV330]